MSCYKGSSLNNVSLGTDCERNSKILNGQTEIVKSEDRQAHGQENETNEKYRTHKTTLYIYTFPTTKEASHRGLVPQGKR